MDKGYIHRGAKEFLAVQMVLGQLGELDMGEFHQDEFAFGSDEYLENVSEVAEEVVDVFQLEHVEALEVLDQQHPLLLLLFVRGGLRGYLLGGHLHPV